MSVPWTQKQLMAHRNNRKKTASGGKGFEASISPLLSTYAPLNSNDKIWLLALFNRFRNIGHLYITVANSFL